MPTSPSSIQARLRLACVLTVLLFCIRYARGQAPTLQPAIQPPSAEQESASTAAYKPLGEGASIKVNFPSAPIQAIIPFYQELTGRKLILDSNLAGNPLRIISPHLLTREQAIAYIESTLLLNGYTFIHMDATTSKLINHGANANVPAAGLPVYNTLSELPVTEEICHFVLPLQYVTASDAAKAFTEVIKPHTYGALMPVANDTALLITENSTTIRSIVRIAQIIDVPPAQTANETIKLQRADVEIVAEIINEMFEEDEDGGSNQPAPTAPAPAIAAPRGQLPAGTATPVNTATSTSSSDRGAIKVKVIPYRRTNELIVRARPVDIAYIRGLVEKLDKQDDGDTFRKFRLNYLSVSDFLASARDTLARDTDIQSESGGASSGGGRRDGRSRQTVGRSNDTAANAPTDNSRSGLNNNGFNSGFGTGGMGTGNANRSLLDDPEGVGAPESIIVGKTLLIADPQSNSLIVSGSPEHIQRIEQLLEEMDTRPQQIYISAIIGQLNLGTEFNYGFDFLRLLDDFSMRDAASAAAGVAATGTIAFPANFKEFAYNKLNFYGQVGPLGDYIKLVDGNRNFKVLATPSVYAKNASKAVIQSGQKIAVPASILSNGAFAGGVASNSVSVEYRDVLLKLEVIPLINSDDEVTLRIAQINDNIVGTQNISGNTVPTIGTQELVTEVAVKDGASVVLGGLITERVNDSARGGIFLRRIPIVKHLFGATEKSSTREELLIFIQPHIMKSTDSLDGPNRIENGRSNLYEEALEFSSPRLQNIPKAVPYRGGK
ncbi:MAG: secretin N-terminal domain-containing protein [Verrucomicrobiaceae bacterium]